MRSLHDQKKEKENITPDEGTHACAHAYTHTHTHTHIPDTPI